MTELLVTEATTSVAPQAVEGKKNRLLVGLITPGQGSSGYYSQPVLEAAASDKVFAAGTHMYLDHPTESEEYERPERSVRDLAAVLTEDARWDADAGALVAETEVFGPYAEAIVAMKDHIGVSIRASAEVSESPKGRTIERLVAAESADFVTKAGRGGSIMSVLESSRPRVNARALRHDGVEEATVNDRREALATLLKDTYGGEKVWVYLRDFDDTTAWFEIESGDDAGIWQQAYSSNNDIPSALAGDRVEVRVSTTYVPVAPAGQSITTTESHQEDIMATTQIEEAELTGLREQAGRVEALEAERDQAATERDEARAALAQAQATASAQESARARVRESNADLAAPVVERIVAEAMRDLPLGDDHTLDTEAWQRRVDECRTAEEGYIASLAEAQGAGTVIGFGPPAPQNDEATLREANDKQRAGMFGREIKEA